MPRFIRFPEKVVFWSFSPSRSLTFRGGSPLERHDRIPILLLSQLKKACHLWYAFL